MSKNSLYLMIFKLTRFYRTSSNNLLAQWTVRTIRIANYNERVNSTISSLAQTLNSEGIVPVLLKGQANGMLYSDPTMREAGDIDFFFQG